MEEDKAVAYYNELTRKGEGAARFKQGLGFSSASNDAIPSRGSALPSSSSFLNKFVKAASPSKTSELERQVQLESIQSKLKKKPEKSRTDSSSRVSRDHDRENVRKRRRSRSRSSDKDRRYTRRSRSRDSSRHSRRSRSRDGSSRNSRRRSRSRSRDVGLRSRRRSRSRSRDNDRFSRLRSRSRSRDKYSSRRGRSLSRSSSQGDNAAGKKRNRSRSKETERLNLKKRNESTRQKSQQITKVDYGELIKGYDNMTPAERVKAKMKLQLSETAVKDESKGVGSGWERFNFDKDAPLDDEEIEAAEDDTVLVKQIGQSFRYSAVETRKEDELKAAHDEAMFGAPSLSKIYIEREDGKLSPVGNYAVNNGDNTEEEDNMKEEEANKVNPLSNLLSSQALSMQQGSWRDRVRKL